MRLLHPTCSTCNGCVIDFSHRHDKISDKSNLSREGFILTQFEGMKSIMAVVGEA